MFWLTIAGLHATALWRDRGDFGMSLNTMGRLTLPQDMLSAYQVLDGLTGSRAATHDLLLDRRWPGGGMFGPGRPPLLHLAQATTMPMPGFNLPPGLSPRAAIVLDGVVVTAASVLAAVASASRRATMEDAIRRYGLDRSSAVDMLAAHAYALMVWQAPISHWDLPYAGPVNERAAKLVMEYERTHPGTAVHAFTGHDRAAMDVIDGLVEDAVRGTRLYEPLERTAWSPALSTTSVKARTILGIQQMPQWVAHHLIPFGVMKAQPMPFQEAVVASGWKMDSEENLIALPGNLQTFLSEANSARLPYQQGPHGMYDAQVATSLRQVVVRALSNSTVDLRGDLKIVEVQFRNLIKMGRFNQRVG